MSLPPPDRESPDRPAVSTERELSLPTQVYVPGSASPPATTEAGRLKLPGHIIGSPVKDIPSARRDGRTRQSSLLVMVPIRAGEIEPLETLLARIADPSQKQHYPHNPVMPFAKLSTVHFLRILIHPASPSEESPLPTWRGQPQVSGPPIPAKLLFSTDFDGPLAAHIDELIDRIGPGLDQVFGHCEGWPGLAKRKAVHTFLRRHRVPSNTFYTGTMNRSVDQIHREAKLREVIEAFLDEQSGRPDFPTEAAEIRARIIDHVQSHPELAWAATEPGPLPRPLLPPALMDRLGLTAGVALLVVLAAAVGVLTLFLTLGQALAVVLGLVALVAVVGVVSYRKLRFLAARDPVIIREDVDDHTKDLVQTEDRIVQNEMSSVLYIKRPLVFRRAILRLVLAFINFSARYLSNQGTLAGIPSIHFARWVIVDRGRRLVFFSNFDGSWENYLGDFIDRAHTGLTAVWSNCVGFPRTSGLTGGGATDEQNFKAYSRQSQVPTQVWYSAYRWLSVSNINDNTRLRLGLYGTMTGAQAEAWLRGPVARKMAKPDSKPIPAPPVDLDDVQGLVARSYIRLKHAYYLPVKLPRADGPVGEDSAEARRREAAARAWLASLVGAVTPAARRSAAVAEHGEATNVAFTRRGLRGLGLTTQMVSGFSREFEEGMISPHRQRLLGDTGPAAPETWAWGGPGQEIDAMLFLFAGTSAKLRDLAEREKARASAHGVELGQPLDTILLENDKEHFGFHDGIAQPRVAGMGPKETEAEELQPEVPTGELVLGYPNAYGILPRSPSVEDSQKASDYLSLTAPDEARSDPSRDLGRNGTYVVFRQLEQDVRAFWRFADERAGSDPERRKWLAAKMVGRWPNGAPLVNFPEREPATFDEKKANDFGYREDLAGERCPLGAHIRRSNPRDGMLPNTADSLLVADRHRLLRRGRPYGKPLADSFDPGDVLAAPTSADDARGLHFICFSTDIARQFEFVQNTWINNQKFDGLYQDPDPLTAPHVDPTSAPPEEVSNFTIPRCPVRHREKQVPRFVTMRGGAYLFMPGLTALRYLADLGD